MFNRRGDNLKPPQYKYYMNIAEIKKQYESNVAWAQETRNALKAEIIETIGNREWHFEPRKFNNEEYAASRMAGLRVVDGNVQYCEAGGAAIWRVHYENGKEVARVRVWRWARYNYKHISWWLTLYEIFADVKDTCEKCEPLAGDFCTKDYKEPFAGREECSILC